MRLFSVGSLSVLLGAAVTLAVVSGCVDPHAPVDPSSTELFVFEVPKGSSASGLTGRLAKAGLIAADWKWKLYLRQADASCLKAGRFQVRRSMSMHELLQTLCGPGIPNDEPFTVVEGWRIREIDEALAARSWIQPGEYARLAQNKAVNLPFEINSPTLEGYLYPETYMVQPEQFSAAAFIERQLQTFQERFLQAHGDKLGGRTLHEVVVMASMLEREEPKPEKRPLVAGILWKRIEQGWALGVDATSRYTLKNWNDRRAFLRQLRDPNDVYNTRLNQGLPPTAIGNPSMESLKAAVKPVSSPYWYYLHDAQQNLHPARSAAEHEANRAKYNVY